MARMMEPGLAHPLPVSSYAVAAWRPTLSPSSPLSSCTLCNLHSEGGMFKAKMTFPPDYPNMPPELRFTSEMWHPNVHEDGKVCISILHPPGDDQYGYESAEERWRPIHTVESVLISVISMISSPNDESPANVDAAKQLREDAEGFRKKVTRLVRLSQDRAFD
mmetsp:Transcript_46434/g.121877  ORF Transcript_46434/g.121877 Transcript_46434/m.121877 type:complete len:163 (-) Transcript_46434:532-1020(-)